MSFTHRSTSRALPPAFLSVQLCIVIGYVFFLVAFALFSPPLAKAFKYIETCYVLSDWLSALLSLYSYWMWGLAGAGLVTAILSALLLARWTCLVALLASTALSANMFILIVLQSTLLDSPEILASGWIHFDEQIALIVSYAVFSLTFLSIVWWCYVLLRSFRETS